jgi:hypothetical protein
MLTLVPTKALTSVDFPVFEAPRTATNPQHVFFLWFPSEAMQQLYPRFIHCALP